MKSPAGFNENIILWVARSQGVHQAYLADTD